MRIGFNLFPYSKGRHGGAEVYLTQIVHEMIAGAHKHQVVLIGEREVLDQFDDAPKVEKLCIPRIARRGRFLRIVAEQLIMPLIVARRRLACLVSNYVVPVASPCRNVVIVHDMLYRRFPDTMERSKRLFWSVMIPLTLWRSTVVATVSEFSASEIAHFHPATKRKLHVTVEGVRPSLANAGPAVRPEWLEGRPYLICVATFGRHKNLELLIDAFCRVGVEQEELDLVIVGAARTPDAMANRDELARSVTDRLSAGRIRFADHVSDEQLAYLYGNAEALVLPSLYEGFGLPVIEAQHFGCPVICSNRASLPEVAGDAALIFDPGKAGELDDKIVQLLSDDDLRQRLRASSRANVARYSWRRATAQLLRAIEKTE
jgi:glycosyltransferase involved in cell wall biosynthesis